jgi:hypothetical protein
MRGLDYHVNLILQSLFRDRLPLPQPGGCGAHAFNTANNLTQSAAPYRHHFIFGPGGPHIIFIISSEWVICGDN